jgi:hypothetical protein
VPRRDFGRSRDAVRAGPPCGLGRSWLFGLRGLGFDTRQGPGACHFAPRLGSYGFRRGGPVFPSFGSRAGEGCVLRLVVSGFLLVAAPAVAQTGSSSGGAGGSASSGSATTPAPLSPPPLAPNLTPTQSAPVTRPGETQPRVDPSPTQAAPLPSEVPGAGGATPPRPATATSSSTRAAAAQPTDDERERQRREEKLRASERRLRRLISDICTGCTGTPPPRR